MSIGVIILIVLYVLLNIVAPLIILFDDGYERKKQLFLDVAIPFYVLVGLIIFLIKTIIEEIDDLQ